MADPDDKAAYHAALKLAARALERGACGTAVARYEGASKFVLITSSPHPVVLKNLGYVLTTPLSRAELERLRTDIDTLLADTTRFS